MKAAGRQPPVPPSGIRRALPLTLWQPPSPYYLHGFPPVRIRYRLVVAGSVYVYLSLGLNIVNVTRRITGRGGPSVPAGSREAGSCAGWAPPPPAPLAVGLCLAAGTLLLYTASLAVYL